MPGQNQAPGEVFIGYNGDGQPEYGMPGGGQAAPTTPIVGYGDNGQPTYGADFNDPNTLQNLRMAFKETHNMSDDQLRSYLTNAGVKSGSFQLGDNVTSNNGAYPLTRILDNKKQWWDYVAPAVAGGLAAAGGAGLFGMEALGGGGAGVGGGLGGLGSELGGGLAGADLGGASLASQGLTTGAGTGVGSFATGGGLYGEAGLGTLGAGGLGINYAPDAPGNSPGMGTGMDAFGNMPGDAGYDATTANAANMPGYNPGAAVPQPDISNLGAAPGSQFTQGVQSAGSNALSRIMDGTATPADYLSIAGSAGSSILGYLGSEAKANALSGTADKYLALGAPYRGMLAQSYSPDFKASNIPGYTDAIDNSMNSYLRKASTGGNPFTNPGVSTEALKYVTAGTALPELNTYRSQLASQGGLGLNTAGTASLGAAGATGGTYDALGYGLGQITTPQNSLADLLKQYGIGGAPKLNLSGVA